MIYAMVPGSALVINLIINWELFKKYGFSIKGNDEKKWVHVRYNYFVLAACGYFLVDMTWGILYEHKEVQAFFPFIYFLTVLYFLFMLLTMLTWTRYIVAYLASLPEVNAKNPIYHDFTKVTAKNVVAFFS